MLSAIKPVSGVLRWPIPRQTLYESRGGFGGPIVLPLTDELARGPMPSELYERRILSPPAVLQWSSVRESLGSLRRRWRLVFRFALVQFALNLGDPLSCLVMTLLCCESVKRKSFSEILETAQST